MSQEKKNNQVVMFGEMQWWNLPVLKLKDKITSMRAQEILRIRSGGRQYFWDGKQLWRGVKLKGK